ncbi:MAG: thioredoxin [Parachlamydiaceae bacterium]
MSQNVKHLNDENFKSTISSGVTLVDFFADWCGPCKMIAPIINELADELQGQAAIAKVDIDASPKTTSGANVTSVPTLILFKNGVEVKRMVGVRDKKSLKAMVLEVL